MFERVENGSIMIESSWRADRHVQEAEVQTKSISTRNACHQSIKKKERSTATQSDDFQVCSPNFVALYTVNFLVEIQRYWKFGRNSRLVLISKSCSTQRIGTSQFEFENGKKPPSKYKKYTAS